MRTAIALCVITWALVACITDSNRCLPGFAYAPQYDACLELPDAADGGDDAGDSGPATEGDTQ